MLHCYTYLLADNTPALVQDLQKTAAQGHLSLMVNYDNDRGLSSLSVLVLMRVCCTSSGCRHCLLDYSMPQPLHASSRLCAASLRSARVTVPHSSMPPLATCTTATAFSLGPRSFVDHHTRSALASARSASGIQLIHVAMEEHAFEKARHAARQRSFPRNQQPKVRSNSIALIPNQKARTPPRGDLWLHGTFCFEAQNVCTRRINSHSDLCTGSFDTLEA